MTSNLANDEIADHALQLRHEAEVAAKQRANNDVDYKGIFLKYTDCCGCI